jgi:hypothetical protein
MAVITGQNNGSLKEIMDAKLQDLKAAQNFLTSKLKDGSSLNVQMANNRGFRVALDYTRNVSMGFMNPAGGNLTKTDAPVLDNMTASLVYVQFGQEITNLQLANSPQWAHVGPSAKAIAAAKLLQRRAETEEYFFCSGTTGARQVIGNITSSASTSNGVQGTVTCSGAADGLGTYLMGVGQYVRVYSSVFAFKHSGYITAKSNNTTIGYTPDVITTTGVVSGDVILPDSDSTSPTTTSTAGLRYFLNATGTMFDKTNVAALATVIDSSTTTLTRTTMEALYRNSKVRAGRNPQQRNVCSEAQLSTYYSQFYSTNTPAVNIWGDNRPGIDIGGKSLDEYTWWGQPIDSYAYIHPANWWMLDYSSLTRMTLKEAGAMLVPAGQFVQKISGGAYANAQQSWDDDYLQFLSPMPFKNAGFTNLTVPSVGTLVLSPYTGSV